MSPAHAAGAALAEGREGGGERVKLDLTLGEDKHQPPCPRSPVRPNGSFRASRRK